MNTLALLLIGITGIHGLAYNSATVRVTDGRQLVVFVTAEYETVPSVVGVRVRDCYNTLLPPFRVRLAAVCVGAGSGWFDVTDGTTVNKQRVGARCYWVGAPRVMTQGQMYIVTGIVQRAGQVIVFGVGQ